MSRLRLRRAGRKLNSAGLNLSASRKKRTLRTARPDVLSHGRGARRSARLAVRPQGVRPAEKRGPGLAGPAPIATLRVRLGASARNRRFGRNAELAAIRAGAGQASEAETHHDPGRRLGDGRGDHAGLEQIGERVRASGAAEIGPVGFDLEYVLQGDQIGSVCVQSGIRRCVALGERRDGLLPL